MYREVEYRGEYYKPKIEENGYGHPPLQSEHSQYRSVDSKYMQDEDVTTKFAPDFFASIYNLRIIGKEHGNINPKNVQGSGQDSSKNDRKEHGPHCQNFCLYNIVGDSLSHPNLQSNLYTKCWHEQKRH